MLYDISCYEDFKNCHKVGKTNNSLLRQLYVKHEAQLGHYIYQEHLKTSAITSEIYQLKFIISFYL